MKLIVLMAFNQGDDGELFAAFDPREMRDAEQARRQAQMLAPSHAGVVTWQREVDPDNGDYGPPEIIFQAGDVPDMD